MIEWKCFALLNICDTWFSDFNYPWTPPSKQRNKISTITSNKLRATWLESHEAYNFQSSILTLLYESPEDNYT
jgi:hypothetical protein